MNEELFLKEQNEKFWGLSIRFLEGYVIEGSRWLKLYEDEGIEAGQINGHIAFLFREWLHYVDGIGVLFNSSNTYAARVLLRSAWEIFLQFKYFLDDYSDTVMKNKFTCYLVAAKVKKIKFIKEQLAEAQQQNNLSEIEKLQKMLDFVISDYNTNPLFADCSSYKRKMKRDQKLNWHGLYSSNKTSINSLAKGKKAISGQSLEMVNNLIYGMLSETAHGHFVGDGCIKEDGKLKFAPIRFNLGGSFVLLIVQIMFEDILATLKDYYGDKIDFEKVVTSNLIENQRKLLVKIKSIDTIFEERCFGENKTSEI